MKRYYIFFETHEDNTYLEVYAGSDEKFEKRENMIKVQGESLVHQRFWQYLGKNRIKRK